MGDTSKKSDINKKQAPDVKASKQKQNGGIKNLWRYLCWCSDRQKSSAPPENRASSTHPQDHQAKLERKLQSKEEDALTAQARKALTALSQAVTYGSYPKQIYNPVKDYFSVLQQYIKEGKTDRNKEDLEQFMSNGNQLTDELVKHFQSIQQKPSNDIASDVLPSNKTSDQPKKTPGIVIEERSQADQLVLDEARVALEEQRSSLQRSLTLFKDLLEDPDALQRALDASKMEQDTFRAVLQQHEQDAALSFQENSNPQELNNATEALRSHEEWVSLIHDQAVGKGKGKT